MSRETERRGNEAGQAAVQTVAELLEMKAQSRPDADLVCVPPALAEDWSLDKDAWTFGDVAAEANALGAAYSAAGYGPGHRVALLLENRPVHYVHWLALAGIGVSVVPLNPDSRASELHYILSHSESAAVVTLAQRRRQVAETAGALGLPVVLPGDVPPRPAPVAPPPEADGREAECALLYTSGTTGKPKGCLLSHGYFLAWGEWYAAQGGAISLRPWQERLLTPLPTFHVNAMGNSFVGMLHSGGAQIIVDRFHPRSWWTTARETRATCFHYLGVMPAILLALPHDAAERDHTLRFGLGGGVHPNHHGAFEERFGVPLLEGWAMTETGGAALLCSVEEPRHVGKRCIGRADRLGPPMEAAIVDDDGERVPHEQPGELLVRARGLNPRAHFFSGYFKDPETTQANWTGDWFRTGDIVKQDAAGAIFFVDRKKNIIRRSGENIAAMEVEGVLAAHPAVRQVAVVAVLDEIRGEEVLAAIVTDGNVGRDSALARQILKDAASKLAYFKLPGWIAFLDELPTTTTQKVRKADLGAVAHDPENNPACIDLRAEKQALRETAL
ncbi:MAG: AMP-binding protein [Pseudomonadota bacterium]